MAQTKNIFEIHFKRDSRLTFHLSHHWRNGFEDIKTYATDLRVVDHAEKGKDQKNNSKQSMMSHILASKIWTVPRLSSVRSAYGRSRIGCRDWVGFGQNGTANYKDDPHFPFPAVRFMENSKEILALRQKEKGDWNALCCEEKKALYRASFCQTFAEFQAFTGGWKFIMGWVFLTTSFGFWAMIFVHHYVHEPILEDLDKYHQKAKLRRMLELHVNPIDGISSLWDYDADRWK